MSDKFLIKNFSQNNLEKELLQIDFDKNYLKVAIDKYDGILLKIYALTPIQATIIKQTALSVGTDCAVAHGVLNHSVETTDCILFATKNQLKEIIKKLYLQPFKLKILADNLNKFLNKNLNSIKIREKVFNWEKPYIMGILNCTPNSFSDGGEFFNPEHALSHFSTLVNAGADIIDIGAESTAPNSKPITQEEEFSRLENILIDARKNNKEIPISIDTRNALTAKKAIELGADIINDVSGLHYDEKMLEIALNFNPYIILNFDGIINHNTIDDTIKGLIARVEKAVKEGVLEEKIILDVGLGFNKTYEQNFELIKHADEICSLGFPVLYGLSRKSFVQKITNLSPKETEFANVSLASYLVEKGVNIIRVHNVLSHKIAFQALAKVLYD